MKCSLGELRKSEGMTIFPRWSKSKWKWQLTSRGMRGGSHQQEFPLVRPAFGGGRWLAGLTNNHIDECFYLCYAEDLNEIFDQ